MIYPTSRLNSLKEKKKTFLKITFLHQYTHSTSTALQQHLIAKEVTTPQQSMLIYEYYFVQFVLFSILKILMSGALVMYLHIIMQKPQGTVYVPKHALWH